MTKKQIEKEVNRQAVLFEEDCKRGQITAAVKFQTLCEQWFEEYAKLNLRPTSIQRLRGATVRVYPALGHKRMDKITARDIQKFITDLVTNGKNMRTGKPLSKKTAVHHLNLISDVFQEARARNCEAISTALEFTRKPKEQPAIVQTASA